MSVVIIGGNECMERQYQQICKKHGCKAKVFVKEKSGFSKQIGTPDLMILFTNTVSHKMVLSAVTEAKKNDVDIVRTHSSSVAYKCFGSIFRRKQGMLIKKTIKCDMEGIRNGLYRCIGKN